MIGGFSFERNAINLVALRGVVYSAFSITNMTNLTSLLNVTRKTAGTVENTTFQLVPTNSLM